MPCVHATGTVLSADNQNVSFVSMSVDVASLRSPFRLACTGSRRMLDNGNTTANATLTVSVLYGFASNTTFDYGFNNTVVASQGSFKINIQYTNW